MTGKCAGKRRWFLFFCVMLAVCLLCATRVMAQENPDPPAAEENTLEIRFYGKDGTVYEKLTRKMAPGSTLTFPAVPSWEEKKNSGWKLEKDGPDTDGFVFVEGDTLQLSLEDSLGDYVKNNVLSLYAIEPRVLELWNNSGTEKFSSLEVFPGKEIFLPDFPDDEYVNFGWTSVRGGKDVEYAIGDAFAVKEDGSLYMVRYGASKVKTITFFAADGGSSARFEELTIHAVKGSQVKLPEVPDKTGYTTLGWSKKKNASKVTYLPGDTLDVKKDLKLYAVWKKTAAYQVTFQNNAGTSTSRAYLSLARTVIRGESIELPEVPPKKGMKGVGWTTIRRGKKAQYQVGAKYRVTKNITFYAVMEKTVTYTVNFYNTNGAQGTSFAALKQIVPAGGEITLPANPARKGMVGQGWSTTKNSSVAFYAAGEKLQVNGNMSFYGVYKKAVTVSLYKNDGTLYKTISVGKGEYFTLPAARSKNPYTMMGWSSSPHKQTDPEFEAGESLRLVTDRKFYAVVFNRNNEEDYPLSSLPSINTGRYRKVIFVGDSRTERMSYVLEKEGSQPFLKNVSFVAKGGEGLAWLRSEGYQQLIGEIGTGKGKPVAVVFNMGINDLTNVDNYVSYYQEIADDLTSRGCKLFYMSLNPINSENLKATGRAERKEEAVRTFNSHIRSRLCGGGDNSGTYIDLYTYLMKNGYGTDSGTNGQESGVDDGLHYTIRTYKRIYKYCIDFLNGRFIS